MQPVSHRQKRAVELIRGHKVGKLGARTEEKFWVNTFSYRAFYAS